MRNAMGLSVYVMSFVMILLGANLTKGDTLPFVVSNLEIFPTNSVYQMQLAAETGAPASLMSVTITDKANYTKQVACESTPQERTFYCTFDFGDANDHFAAGSTTQLWASADSDSIPGTGSPSMWGKLKIPAFTNPYVAGGFSVSANVPSFTATLEGAALPTNGSEYEYLRIGPQGDNSYYDCLSGSNTFADAKATCKIPAQSISVHNAILEWRIKFKWTGATYTTETTILSAYRVQTPSWNEPSTEPTFVRSKSAPFDFLITGTNLPVMTTAYTAEVSIRTASGTASQYCEVTNATKTHFECDYEGGLFDGVDFSEPSRVTITFSAWYETITFNTSILLLPFNGSIPADQRLKFANGATSVTFRISGDAEHVEQLVVSDSNTDYESSCILPLAENSDGTVTCSGIAPLPSGVRLSAWMRYAGLDVGGIVIGTSSLPKPVVTPASGSYFFDVAEITIGGSNFGDSSSELEQVLLNDNEVVAVWVSNTTITVRAQDNMGRLIFGGMPTGAIQVVVVVNGERSESVTIGQYFSPPALDGTGAGSSVFVCVLLVLASVAASVFTP